MIFILCLIIFLLKKKMIKRELQIKVLLSENADLKRKADKEYEEYLRSWRTLYFLPTKHGSLQNQPFELKIPRSDDGLRRQSILDAAEAIKGAEDMLSKQGELSPEEVPTIEFKIGNREAVKFPLISVKESPAKVVRA